LFTRLGKQGGKISPQIEARDGREVIVCGWHKRVVIRSVIFAKRVKVGGG
jgi:predicted thioesterase